MIDKTTVFITTQRGIPLGYQGENEAREIVFPQPEELLVENWMLLHQRALDKEPYPVPLDVTARGLVWTVAAGDTDISGNGRAQLICTGADGEVLKTCTYTTAVSKSLHVGGEPPDPVKPWYDDIMEWLGNGGGYYSPQVEQVSEAAVTFRFVASREDMPPVEPVTVTLPAGPQGDPGPAGHTPTKGTDYWTESDKVEIVQDTLAALPTWAGGDY